MGGIAYYIDSEHRIDKAYAKTIGVNVDALLYKAPGTLEDVLETIDKTIDIMKKLRNDDALSEGIKTIPLLIIVDSVSIATRAEKEGEFGKGGKGEHARLISSFLRRITPEISKANVAVLFVCQIKSKINMGYGSRGSKETFLAEDTLRYHCTIGLRTQRISTLRNSKNVRYSDVDLYVTTKNSCLPPFQEAEVELHYGIGFNYYASLTDTLLEYYGAESKGSWYSHKDIGKWQGKDGIRKLLEKDPKKKEAINKILATPMTVNIGSTRGATKKEEVNEEEE
jgi:recombination protein RecA